VTPPRVVVYSKDFCGPCQRAKTLLRNRGVSFEEIDIEEDDEHRATMIALTGRRTVPQVFINDRHVGGADDLQALAASGALDALLTAS
jgi:glutaredoxin 3